MKRDPKTGKLPPKKRNERALRLVRERKQCGNVKKGDHVPLDRFAAVTRCKVCGIRLEWSRNLKKRIVG